MEIAFSSSDTAVLEAWHRSGENYRLYVDAAWRFAEEFNGTPVGVDRGHERVLVGVECDIHPGDGWRRDQRKGYYTPDRRLKVGKEFRKRMEAIKAEDQRKLPGMPDIVFDDRTSRWSRPAIGKHGDTLWVGWPCAIELIRESGWSAIKFDDTIWQLRPLSEYYAAKEAHELERANDG